MTAIAKPTLPYLSQDWKVIIRLLAVYPLFFISCIQLIMRPKHIGGALSSEEIIGSLFYAPVFETILFHLPVCWFLLKVSKNSMTITILISTIGFALLHEHPQNLIMPSLGMAWCFCFYHLRFGPLAASLLCALLHFLYNLTCLFNSIVI